MVKFEECHKGVTFEERVTHAMCDGCEYIKGEEGEEDCSWRGWEGGR